jgi:uncharacterized membrane protein YphA (DoxX/SURF4 family)
LFRAEGLTWPQALLILGGLILLVSFSTYLVTFTKEAEEEAKEEHDKALALRAKLAKERREEKAKARPKRVAPVPSWRSLTAVDLLRFYLGIALAIKGIFFILNMQEFEAVESLGRFQNVTAWFVVFVHTVGGAALLIGIATRLAAAANIVVVLGAIIFVHSSGSHCSCCLRFVSWRGREQGGSRSTSCSAIVPKKTTTRKTLREGSSFLASLSGDNKWLVTQNIGT